MSNANKYDSHILVWDLPTRVFHWSLLISFSAAWLTAENDRFLYHHVFAGYLFFGLLAFRLVWGAVGSYYSRFRSFAYNWPSVWAYLKGLLTGEASRHVGHNPAGSWAIFLMLLLGFVISITGLIVLGGEEGHGILKGLVSYDTGEGAKEIHESIAEFMLFVVFIHLAGVIVESIFHKENLIWSMIVGTKPAQPEAISARNFHVVAVVMLMTIFGSAVYYFHGYFTQTKDRPFLAFTHDPLPDNATWRTECGECHVAYHPTLLPARSWKRIMDESADHFGDDITLEQDVADEILNFMTQNAAESGLTEVAHKVNKDVPADQTPIRITETRYWKHKHGKGEIDEKYWKLEKVKSKANCDACHLDAKDGWYEDSNMQLPDLPK